MATVNLLRPHHAPMTIQVKPLQTEIHSDTILKKEDKHQHKSKHLRAKLAQTAAALIIFVAGVATGWSNLFTTDAKATPSPSIIFEQAIKNVQNAGSFIITMKARTQPNENMAHFDPDLDFIRINLKVLNQNDSTFWRLEKEGGRTIMFNGREQYMWTSNGLKLRGSANVGFLEGFASLLQPESLLKQQKAAIIDNNHANVRTTETDSITTITIQTELDGDDLYSLLGNWKIKKMQCITENVFTKKDGLLRQIRIWVKRGGNKILILSSSEIKYNILLNKEELVQLPKSDSEWLEIEAPQLKSDAHLQTLQKETATEAAQRIMTALTTDSIEQAKEALYYYSQMLPQIVGRLKGCKASEFSDPKKKDDYAGVYVFYKLTSENGTSQMCHLALRYDNDQKIWILDGGL
ncbi:zf-HC2 domain-containing protein [uncultured Bacteroides sp.]|uniref:zf-HC2 domain-containing protein n=1 Tax=uncultured Bacteroides sp. TaxID=162156 RepID=UPI0025D9C562|nr:zf-HC2 domain-containing protein [uncultured Bacteroides sp.]